MKKSILLFITALFIFTMISCIKTNKSGNTTNKGWPVLKSAFIITEIVDEDSTDSQFTTYKAIMIDSTNMESISFWFAEVENRFDINDTLYLDFDCDYDDEVFLGTEFPSKVEFPEWGSDTEQAKKEANDKAFKEALKKYN